MESTQVPTIGRTVLYQLSDFDADEINRRRATSTAPRSEDWPEGAQAHVGNQVRVGQEYPAVVVAKFSEDMVNLQVLLDGNDSFWATSRHEGTDPGNWHWPARV